jgi:hypothetical protein
MENIEYEAIEKIVSNLTTKELLSIYPEVYGILREELNNHMVDLIEEYESCPNVVISEGILEYVNINTSRIGNIKYNWKSPTKKGDTFGWIKTGFIK